MAAELVVATVVVPAVVATVVAAAAEEVSAGARPGVVVVVVVAVVLVGVGVAVVAAAVEVRVEAARQVAAVTLVEGGTEGSALAVPEVQRSCPGDLHRGGGTDRCQKLRI